MAFKRSAVRSRLSPPKTRTHVANKGHMSPFPINNRKERIFDQKLQKEQNEGAGLLVYRAIANRLFFCFQREGSSVMHAEVSKYADRPDSRGWARRLSQSGAHAFVHLAQAARRYSRLMEWV